MGLMFTYTLSQCNDYGSCCLDSLIYETITPRVITKADPSHWHLHTWDEGDWVTKTREGCLSKLVAEVNRNYDRFYNEEGKPRNGPR